MRRFPKILRAALVAGSLGVAAPAQATTACSLLAQLNTTGFLNLATAIDSNRSEAIDGAAERLAHLTTSHANLGCDSATLRRTLDCVLDTAGEGRSRDVAQTCLTREGLLGD